MSGERGRGRKDGPRSVVPRRTVGRRRERVLAMRAAGMSLSQIAAAVQTEFGLPRYYRSSAAVDLQRALVEARASGSELTGLHLALELERLDGWTRTAETLMRQAMGAADRWGALRAMDRLIHLSVRRDALLGLSYTTREVLDDAAGEVPPAGEDGDGEPDVLDEVGRKRAQRRRRWA